jgi:hypothetical protein
VALDLTLADAIPWFLNRYAKSTDWARVSPRT